MKKYLIIIFSVLAVNSFAQNSWIQAGSISQGNSDWIYNIVSDDAGVLYASSWTVGVYRSEDGMNWFPAGLTGLRVSRLRVAPNGDIYALSKTTTVSYIHKSTNKGVTWTDVYAGSFINNYAGGGDIVFPSDGSMLAAFSVTVGPTIGDVAIFVFKSTDGGNNWFQIHQYNVGFVGGMTILSDGRILMGTSLAGVIVSGNNGDTFSNLGTFPSIFVKTVFQTPDNSIYVSDAYGLNRSTDNGLTFIPTGKIPFASVIDATFNSNGDLYLSMGDRNVYRSTNSGDNWVNINNGLPGGNTYIYSLTRRIDRIYGGTNDRGVFYFSKEITVINANESSPENFSLSQNYPNPFNPETVISFSLTGHENVSIIIFDATGNQVLRLIDGDFNAGSHSIRLNASDLPSGVYFYRMRAGNFSQTKSMLLIK